MVGWDHRLDGHEFEQALGVGDGQGAWRAAVQPQEGKDSSESLLALGSLVGIVPTLSFP